MHRVDSDGTILVGGERRFVDRSLPTYEGTEDKAYWNNAVQEEIAQVVEYAGLTLAASGAADQTANWGQLTTAIFSSGAIGSDAIGELTMGKLSAGDTAVTDSSIEISSASVATQYTKSTSFMIEAQSGVVSSGEKRNIQRSGWGDTYSRGSAVIGDAEASVVNDAIMVFDISAFSWTLSSDRYSATINRNTGLKWETGLLSTFAPYSGHVVGDASGITITAMSAVQINMTNASGIINIQTIHVIDGGFDPNNLDNAKLYIRFCESPL